MPGGRCGEENAAADVAVVIIIAVAVKRVTSIVFYLIGATGVFTTFSRQNKDLTKSSRISFSTSWSSNYLDSILTTTLARIHSVIGVVYVKEQVDQKPHQSKPHHHIVMSTSARRRLLRDFRRLQNDPPSGVTGAPMDTNIMLWQAVIFGPDDTPWEGGTFKLVLEFTEDYPNKAPSVRFITRMFHPNIYNDGQICLDILQNQWSPIYDISAILTSIQSLLCDPNPASPANSEASRLYNENRREYNRRVREIVEQSWVDES